MKFKERLKKLERNIITDYYKIAFKNGESKYFTSSQLLRFSLNNTREDFGNIEEIKSSQEAGNEKFISICKNIINI